MKLALVALLAAGLLIGCAAKPTFGDSVARAIADKLLIPEEFQGTPLSSTLRGQLDEFGRWTSLGVERSSGNAKFDAFAMSVVRDAQPLAVPANAVGVELRLELRNTHP
jgi:TonB family protein